MPHLEFATYAGQLFWLAITFVILYFLSSRVVLPNIGGVIESRGKSIAQLLADAEALSKQAEDAELKAQKLVVESSEKARASVEESAKKAREKMEVKRQELTAKLDDKIKKAEAEIAKIEKEAQKVTADLSKDLAKLIVKKVAA